MGTPERNSESPKAYKRYLQPGSEDPIPPSTWYRHQKLRIKEASIEIL